MATKISIARLASMVIDRKTSMIICLEILTFFVII